MNLPDPPAPEHLEYAEYVLGVLDADARAAVERAMADDPAVALEVERWTQYLLVLTEDVPEQAPADYVWRKIEAELAIAAEPVDAARPVMTASWWNNLKWWRGLALATSTLAAACIVALIVLVVPRYTNTQPQAGRENAYMSATITRNNGRVGWIVTIDPTRNRMVVVPARPQTLPTGHAPELWLIPSGKQPIAAGMLTGSGPTIIHLDPGMVAKMNHHAAFAVSVEPDGGSPTGQPTGPVVAKGNITLAASRTPSGKPVTWWYRPPNPRLDEKTRIARTAGHDSRSRPDRPRKSVRPS